MIIDKILNEMCTRLNGRIVEHDILGTEIVFNKWWLLRKSHEGLLLLYTSGERQPAFPLKLSSPTLLDDLELILRQNIEYFDANGNASVYATIIS